MKETILDEFENSSSEQCDNVNYLQNDRNQISSYDEVVRFQSQMSENNIRKYQANTLLKSQKESIIDELSGYSDDISSSQFDEINSEENQVDSLNDNSIESIPCRLSGDDYSSSFGDLFDSSSDENSSVISDIEEVNSQTSSRSLSFRREIAEQTRNFHPNKYHKITEYLQSIQKLKFDLCSICIEEDYLRIMKCKHYFHNDCINRWLIEKNNCPNCRSILNSSF
ncbi:unnamed protein product [Paramecium sonneborni]|uniref:RING-type domain-containing protein n=1 Tax=Paramecium sonneborni TaxID=65129 RepID=A0A8S1QBC7_9CILI|nr:unnamed protein product [Paramecium sonneborni]